MRDSKLKVDTDNPIELSLDEATCHLCPSGCGEGGIELHYLHCPEITAVSVREILIRKVIKKLKTLRTYEGITNMVQLILTNISRREEMEFKNEEFNKEGMLSLTTTIKEQDRIWWQVFCQGYYHKGWVRVQQRYYKKWGDKEQIP